MGEALRITVDGNEAAASVAHRLSEVIAIYPITPSSPMGELADEWSAHGRPNVWGDVPDVIEMQSEGGAAGAVHGALQAGALATTFTASQGLLLMIPNMYKIAGELTPFCMHVAARTLATHALSIFGDHSDVMACRQTGFAMLGSSSVQEAHDLALRRPRRHAAQPASRSSTSSTASAPRTRWRRSRRSPTTICARMIDEGSVARAPRARAVAGPPGDPRHGAEPRRLLPGPRGGEPLLPRLPGDRAGPMDRLRRRTGRHYHLFDYVGDPEAERVIVLMGSGAETARGDGRVARRRAARRSACSRCGCTARSRRRPSLAALPATVRAVAVLDRTKEPGAVGEPLYLDVVAALPRTARARIAGGRAWSAAATGSRPRSSRRRW